MADVAHVPQSAPAGFAMPALLPDARDLAMGVADLASWDLNTLTGAYHCADSLPDLLGLAAGAPIAAGLDALVARLTADRPPGRPGEQYQLECEITRPGGAVGSVQVHAQAYADRRRPSRVAGFSGVVVDRTERAASRRTIADLVDRYRLLVELSPDGVVVHQDGLIVYVNPAGLRLVAAASDAEILHRRITDFVVPKDIAPMLARIAALSSPGAVTTPAEIGLLALDGTIAITESTSVRTSWQGRPAMQVILRDLRHQLAAQDALRYQAALVEHVSDGIVALDGAGLVTSWNPAAQRIYGWSSEQASGRPAAELIGELPSLGQVEQVVHRRQDGQRVTVRVSVSELRNTADEVTGAVIVCADETARLLAERQYAAVVASLQEGVIVLSPTGATESINPAAERLLGSGTASLVGSHSASLDMRNEDGSPLDIPQRPSELARWSGQAVHDVVLGVSREGRERLWLSVSARALTDSGEPPYPVVMSFTDVTERLAAATELRYEATHDALTALANRVVIIDAIATGLSDVVASGGQVTVVFLDLDHFKVINDSLGHGVGDQLLRAVGGRLQDAAGPGDVVGRLGGDEFIVVSRSAATGADATRLAARLRNALAEPFVLADRSIIVGASAGVVVAGQQAGCTAEDLLRDADVAMYQAKDHGRGRHELFDADLRARALRRLQLEEDLRAALHGDQLWIAHQPVIDLKTGLAVSTEALLRWDHPEFGPVSPAEFVPIAEESGLIIPLGIRVLELACAQTAAWRAEGPQLRGLQVAVNLSARQLADPGLVVDVRTVLARTGLPADALWLEITESMLMHDADGATRILLELRSSGVHLSIDDFGTGYSSLAYLRRFPVEALKIDRSFVASMHENADDAVIVASVLTLAHSLGLQVVAEGVETQGQLDTLRSLGCDEVQGYFTGRPARADDVVPALLRTDLH